MATSTRSRTRTQKKRKTMAQRADRHELYERAVQDPPTDVEFFVRTFKKIRGREPLSLREDFCGTSALCLAWVQSHKKRTAEGIDLCEKTMAWGLEKRIGPAGGDYGDRIKQIKDDVRAPKSSTVDMCCALNFSYCIFKDRADLLEYFKAVRAGLNDDGVFIVDMLGGTDSFQTDQTDNDLDDFIYRWEQSKFNVITHEILCHIHFLFPDGSRLDKAFTYDWRLWTAPELRELMLEAGFTKVHFYWEKTDEDGEGTGAFYEPRYVENQDCWWTFMAAEC